MLGSQGHENWPRSPLIGQRQHSLQILILENTAFMLWLVGIIALVHAAVVSLDDQLRAWETAAWQDPAVIAGWIVRLQQTVDPFTASVLLAHSLWPRVITQTQAIASDARFRPLLHAIMQRREESILAVADQHCVERLRAGSRVGSPLGKLSLQKSFVISAPLPIPTNLGDWLLCPWPMSWLSTLNIDSDALYLHLLADQPTPPALILTGMDIAQAHLLHAILRGDVTRIRTLPPELSEEVSLLIARNLTNLPPSTLLNVLGYWLCFAPLGHGLLAIIQAELKRRHMPLLEMRDYGWLGKEERAARNPNPSLDEVGIWRLLNRLAGWDDSSLISTLLSHLPLTAFTFLRLLDHQDKLIPFKDLPLISLFHQYLEIYMAVKGGQPTSNQIAIIRAMPADLKSLLWKEAYLQGIERGWERIAWLSEEEHLAIIEDIIASPDLLQALRPRRYESAPLLQRLRPFFLEAPDIQ